MWLTYQWIIFSLFYFSDVSAKNWQCTKCKHMMIFFLVRDREQQQIKSYCVVSINSGKWFWNWNFFLSLSLLNLFSKKFSIAVEGDKKLKISSSSTTGVVDADMDKFTIFIKADIDWMLRKMWF